MERATIRSFDKFIEEVKLFQQKHKIKINPGTQIKEGIIHKLLASARDEGYDCEEADFYSYSLENISRLMRLHVKPENKMDFEFKLKKNLDFPVMLPNYELSVTNFGPFYEALVIYKGVLGSKLRLSRVVVLHKYEFPTVVAKYL